MLKAVILVCMIAIIAQWYQPRGRVRFEIHGNKVIGIISVRIDLSKKPIIIRGNKVKMGGDV